MREITIQIPDKDYQFFMKLVNTLPFVKGVKPAGSSKKKVLTDLKDSIDELKMIKAGKKKAISAKALLKEI